MSKAMIDIKDVSQKDLDRIRTEFENHPKVRQMRIQQNILQRNGNIRGAMSIGKTLEKLFAQSVQNILEDTENECRKVEMASVNLPKKTADTLDEIMVTLQLAIDVVDTCIMDFNDTLHSVDNTLTLESFDDIKLMGDKIKSKLDYFRKKSRLFGRLSFANCSDNMYKLLRNKAGSLIRKNSRRKDNEHQTSN